MPFMPQPFNAIGACSLEEPQPKFFRNAINIGLPIFESREAAGDIQEGDEVEIDMGAGKIINRTRGKNYGFEPFPKEILEIIEAGGLMQFVKKRMGK